MQIVSKLLYAFFSLPGIFIVIIALLAVFAIRKPSQKLLGIVLFLLTFIIYITSVPIFAISISSVISHAYQRQLPPKGVKAAAVVLAGGWSTDENGQPFQPSIATMERLYAAIKLSKEYPACAFLIMSGGDTYERSAISVATIMKDAAEIMDCKAKIILEDKSRNTDENIKYSAEIIKELGIKHVVIVTSNSHMGRAMDFAYRYMPDDIKLYAYPSGGYEKREVKLTPEMFLPDVQALSKSCVAIKELIGGVVAKLTGA